MKRDLLPRGFAVVDLIACVAAGGVLLALVMPTLQSTREVARLAECKDRLAAIAKAAHDFHDVHMRLPPGTLNYETPPNGLEAAKKTPGYSQEECQNLSALFLTLPFMEIELDLNATDVYDSVDARLPDLKRDLRQTTDDSTPPKRVFESQYRYGDGAGAHWPKGKFIRDLYDDSMGPDGVATTEIPNFKCPADQLNAEPELPSIVVSMPYFNGTSLYGTPLDDVFYVAAKNMELAQTNYVAVAGTTSCINVPSPLGKWGGAMSGRMTVTLEQVANLDGTSKTFMYGESLGDVGGIAQLADDGAFVLDGRPDAKIVVGTRTLTRAWVWGGIGILASYNFPWGTMQHPDFKDPDPDRPGRWLKLLGDAELADPGSYSSPHDAGVNFAMVDGSVHTVPRKITWQLYYGNGGLRDGAPERGF